MTEANPEPKNAGRRRALKVLGATLGATAFAAAMEPLKAWTDDLTFDQFMQRHYRELTPEQLQAVLRRVEAETKEKYGREVHCEDVRPMEGVEFGYALNLSVCIGCRKCAEACHHVDGVAEHVAVGGLDDRSAVDRGRDRRGRRVPDLGGGL